MSFRAALVFQILRCMNRPTPLRQLQVFRLPMAHPGDLSALADLLDAGRVRADEVVAVIGPNASGKTTLLKPLLFTGAMLPSDHDAADGPANITGALDFLIDSLESMEQFDGRKSPPFGLLMQGLFTPAQCVVKQSTAGLDAFDGPYSVLANAEWQTNWEALSPPEDLGLQGQFAKLFDKRASQHPLFEAMEVPVVFCSPGNGPLRQLADLLNRKPASVVVAAPGHGNIPDVCVPVLRRLLLNGVSVVRASRVAEGGVEQGGEFDALDEFREDAAQNGKTGVFSEAGSLSLAKSVVYERLRVLAHSLAV